MDKIYEHSSDVHVVARYIYMNRLDNHAYADKLCTQKIGPDELENLFIKGAVLKDASGLYKPIAFKPILDTFGLIFVDDVGDELDTFFLLAHPEGEPTIVVPTEPITVIPTEPSFEDNVVTIPTVEGVVYLVDEEAVTEPIVLSVETDSVIITAAALPGFVIPEEVESSWTFNFT